MSKIVTVFVLIYIIGVAVFVGKVQNVITVAVNNKSHFSGESPVGGESSKMILGDAYSHLLIFLQVIFKIITQISINTPCSRI